MAQPNKKTRRKQMSARRAQKNALLCGRCGFCGGNWNKIEEEVAQKWIQEDSKHRVCGRHCCCPYICYRRCYIRFSYIIFVVIVIVRLIIYAFEPMIFPSNNPYDEYRQTECKVIESTLVNGSDQEMRCHTCDIQGSQCWNTYPCMRIRILYATMEEKNITTLLRASEIEINELLQCSYKPTLCNSNTSLLRQQVEIYQQDWGNIGQNYSCFYNPRSTDIVLRERMLPSGYVRHWATLVLFILLSIFGIIIVFLSCGCKYVWSSHAPESIRIEVADKSQGQAMVEHA